MMGIVMIYVIKNVVITLVFVNILNPIDEVLVFDDFFVTLVFLVV
jgi:hypothetical protein